MAGRLKGRPLPADSLRNVHLQLCRAVLNEGLAAGTWCAAAPLKPASRPPGPALLLHAGIVPSGAAAVSLAAAIGGKHGQAASTSPQPNPTQTQTPSPGTCRSAVAGAAVAALYALHPHPHGLLLLLLDTMARQAFGEPGSETGPEGLPSGQVRLAKLERLFFVLGRCGMLLHRWGRGGGGGGRPARCAAGRWRPPLAAAPCHAAPAAARRLRARHPRWTAQAGEGSGQGTSRY
jgi:hypothetical protein